MQATRKSFQSLTVIRSEPQDVWRLASDAVDQAATASSQGDNVEWIKESAGI
jgi:hypothetical protein